MKFIVLILPIVLLTSCFKTAEEIKREKEIDRQLNQSSKIIAELRTELNNLRGTVAATSGQIEEIDYKTKTSKAETLEDITQRLDQLTEQVKVLAEENKSTQQQLASINADIGKQKKYISKVTGTLSEMSGSSSSDLLTKANKAFSKNQQKKAKDLYQEVLNQGKISNATKNKVYYNLGLLEYWGSQYNNALIYFSKIYDKYPRSSKAPGSLFYIGLSFKKQKEKAKASAIFQELINKYPKSPFAKKAKKEL